MWGMNVYGDLFIGAIGVLFIWFFTYMVFYLKETWNDE